MKLLIAEDDLLYRHLLRGTLSAWGFAVVETCDGSQAVQALLADDGPRLAILDWMMPGMDGIQVCREIRKQAEKPYVYILLLTARDRKGDIIEGLQAGADDYLTKPFDASELRARLNTGRRIVDLQDQLITTQEALRVQATRDFLTGLWNHGAILEMLHRELARAWREQRPLGLIMADIDYFKAINDAHGHPAGDEVLREAARRMLAVLRPYDAIGRYGGEEFMIVLPNCDLERTRQLAERVRESIGGQPVASSSGAISLTLSLGAASWSPGAAVDAALLLRAADAALYAAKNAGRNRVEVGVMPAPLPS